MFNDGQPSKMLEQHLVQYILYARYPGGIPAYLNLANSNQMWSEVDNFPLLTTISDAGPTSSDMSVV